MKKIYLLVPTFLLLITTGFAQTDIEYEFTNVKNGFSAAGQVALSTNATFLTVTVTNTGGANACKSPAFRSPDNLALTTSDYAGIRVHMRNNSSKAAYKIALHPTAAENSVGVVNLVIPGVETSETAFNIRNVDIPSTYTAAKIERLTFKGTDYSANCGDTFDIDYIYILTNASYSTTEFSKDQFAIKNNPVTNLIEVETFNGLPVTNLSLYDLSGRLVKTVSNAPSLDVNELNSGLYLLNIQSKLGQMTKRIIKK